MLERAKSRSRWWNFNREEKGLGCGHEKMDEKQPRRQKKGSEHTRRARCRKKKVNPLVEPGS